MLFVVSGSKNVSLLKYVKIFWQLVKMMMEPVTKLVKNTQVCFLFSIIPNSIFHLSPNELFKKICTSFVVIMTIVQRRFTYLRECNFNFIVYDDFDSLLKFLLRILFVNCCTYVIETKTSNVFALYFLPLRIYFTK